MPSSADIIGKTINKIFISCWNASKSVELILSSRISVKFTGHYSAKDRRPLSFFQPLNNHLFLLCIPVFF
jgi:hypothetical protein